MEAERDFKPIWNGDMRKAEGRYYVAHTPAPAKFWADHVWCSMAFQKDGEVVSEDVRLTAEQWFAMEDLGNILSALVMKKLRRE